MSRQRAAIARFITFPSSASEILSKAHVNSRTLFYRKRQTPPTGDNPGEIALTPTRAARSFGFSRRRSSAAILFFVL
jgi:hypothetical protein